MFYTKIHTRCILEVGGSDATAFLQGIVTNDVEKPSPQRTLYAALLTPQGKFLHDFTIWKTEGGFYLTPEAGRATDLLKRLILYKLRTNVTFRVREDLFLYALWGKESPEGEKGDTVKEGEDLICLDPRMMSLGSLALSRFFETLQGKEVPLEIYDLHRLTLGIPDGSRDMTAERAIPLECGLDELGAISWDKGCYMGQELTARTRYRGLVRKRLFPVRIEGSQPSNETPVTVLGEERGEMFSHIQNQGLARLRIEDVLQNTPFFWGEARLYPSIPSWMKLI